jgi:two-component system cell cycle response regulator
MKASILAVEDNKDIQRIYSKILSEKYNLSQAYDTKEAWKILAAKSVDLILLDVILPKGKHGDSFYMQLVQHPEYSEIPVIFVTVIDDQISAREFKNLKNASWITKPFTEEQLLAKIEETLQQK